LGSREFLELLVSQENLDDLVNLVRKDHLGPMGLKEDLACLVHLGCLAFLERGASLVYRECLD
jgi:hypothetical protein